jgi:hypothetical protein
MKTMTMTTTSTNFLMPISLAGAALGALIVSVAAAL